MYKLYNVYGCFADFLAPSLAITPVFNISFYLWL